MALQINPAVTQLSLYDIAGTPGVAADIGHINSKAVVKARPALRLCLPWPGGSLNLKLARPSISAAQAQHAELRSTLSNFSLLAIQGFSGPETLGEALKGSHLVIIPAGLPRKPGMTRDDLFKVCSGPQEALFTISVTVCAALQESCAPSFAETSCRLGYSVGSRLNGAASLLCLYCCTKLHRLLFFIRQV